MSDRKLALVFAAVIATVLGVSSPAFAQEFDFDSDIKVVDPHRFDSKSAKYVAMQTLTPLNGQDLFEYFHTIEPRSRFSDFLAANPDLGAINPVSTIDIGTVFYIPRPDETETGD